jgi:hypothetical protein
LEPEPKRQIKDFIIWNIGGDPLEGSGFENEEPEPGFSMEQEPSEQQRASGIFPLPVFTRFGLKLWIVRNAMF